MKEKKPKSCFGQTLIELLIATAIFSLIITPFLSSLVNLLSLQVKYRHRIQAAQYAREGLEIVYNIIINNKDWQNFVSFVDPNKIYHPLSNGTLTLIEGAELLEGGKFTREIVLENGRRDNLGDMTEEPTGTEDKNTVKASCRVSWQDRNKAQSINLMTFFIDFEPL